MKNPTAAAWFMETSEARSKILEIELQERASAAKEAELERPTPTPSDAATTTDAGPSCSSDSSAGIAPYAKGLDQSELRSIFVDEEEFADMLKTTVDPAGLRGQYVYASRARARAHTRARCRCLCRCRCR